MGHQPTLVRSVPDPERPIDRQVYSLDGTELRSKSVADEDIIGYRWNTETTVVDFLLAHLPTRERPARITGPFEPVRLFDEYGNPVNGSEIQTLLKEPSTRTREQWHNARCTLFESLGTVELASADGAIRVHWLNTPDRELLGELSADGLHTFVIEIDRESYDRAVLTWYLNAVSPATADPVEADELSTYLSDNI